MDAPPRRPLRHSPLAASVAFALAIQLPATWAASPPSRVQFNTSFLGTPGDQKIDFSRFEAGNAMLAGEYQIEVIVNEAPLGLHRVRFEASEEGGEARPRMTPALLQAFGVDLERLAEAGADLASPTLDLAALAPLSSIEFDSARQQLHVSVPQALMALPADVEVVPARWERGLNAFVLGYNANVLGNTTRGSDSSLRAYSGLEARLNLNGWRLYSQAGLNWDGAAGLEVSGVRNYAEHDVTALRSQLVVGDAFTTGQLFDSTAFRGLNLSTDLRMFADSTGGFVPIVRGVAETQAQVQVRQQGYLLREINVPPGAFEIADLLPTGYGGDLEVTVIEADGRRRGFTVPYAATPNLLRPGLQRYAFTLGRLRSDGLTMRAPEFIEATYQRGLSNALTAYGGMQALGSARYGSALLGSAFNTRLGALSLDVTMARTRLPQRMLAGSSTRASFSKSLSASRTDLAVSAIRDSNRDYLGLTGAVAMLDAGGDGGEAGMRAGTRRRLQLMLTQRLGNNGGSLSLSGSRGTAWAGQRAADSAFQLRYSQRVGWLTFSFVAARTRDDNRNSDDRYYLNVSVPLVPDAARPPQLSLTASQAPEGPGAMASVSGTAGERQQYTYGLSAHRGDPANAVSGNLGWLAPGATMGASYGRFGSSQQAAVSVSGALLAHRNGVNTVSRQGDTMGLIEARGAHGALLGDGTTRIARNGYAVVANLVPYRVNDVTIDPDDTSEEVELVNSRVQTVPRAGSIVPLRFDTVSGAPVLFRGQQQDGATLPFGARVLDPAGQERGIVAQNGQIFARGTPPGTVLTIRWGDAAEQTCTLTVPPLERAGVGAMLTASAPVPCR